MLPLTLRRALRRLTSWALPQPLLWIYSGNYGIDIPGLPSDPRRAENILTFLAMEGILPRGRLRWPYEASMHSLSRVHTADYLDSLVRPGALEPILGLAVAPGDEDRFLHLQRAMVGGTTLATRLALAGWEPVVNLGGGLHHAHADRGEGFCAVNDVAVAIAQAREAGFDKPILVIDLDLHDGNGTRSIFARDPTVHTFSIHNKTWSAPDASDLEAVASTTIELGTGVVDEVYLGALDRYLGPVIDSMRPGLVYFVAGVDPAAGDALGDWKISPQGMLVRDQWVFSRLRARYGDLPLVVVLAGGYGTEAWRLSARSLAWLASGGKVLDPPTTSEVILKRYRHLASLVRPSELTGESAEGDSFGLTEANLLGGEAPQQPKRFLGYYSANGLELALERYGYLARIRALGYKRPRLVIDTTNPGGDTMRLFGSEGDDELLLELRLARDRRSLPPFELLRIEWLLLQNPRVPFTPGRPPLPGQKHPGLGLLREVIALLVLACDRLGLDGLTYVPAHYHVAAQSERFVRFLDPADAARFERIRRAAARSGLGLQATSETLEQGRLVDPDNGEVLSWKPVPMVAPVSSALSSHLEKAPAPAQTARNPAAAGP